MSFEDFFFFLQCSKVQLENFSPGQVLGTAPSPSPHPVSSPPPPRTLTHVHMRSVLCQEQRVCPSLPAPSPWFLLGQQEGPRLPEPQPALLGLSCHPHYEKFTRTNAQNMALNSPSRVTLLELLLLWESPKAHWQNGFTMSAYLQGLLRGVNEIKHPKMCLAHRQYQASWRPFLSWGTPPPNPPFNPPTGRLELLLPSPPPQT